MDECKEYKGFEQGPIRPPSEAYSLLIRVTRNCPWNKCLFCPVYKEERFSPRPIEDILRDIDQIAKSISIINLRYGGDTSAIHQWEIEYLLKKFEIDWNAFISAYYWHASGMQSVFLQDANSLVLPTEKLLVILRKIKEEFPTVKRITSYARSQTIYKKSLSELMSLREAGLNRLHIGLESGSDNVLKFMCKGVTKQQHIEAGNKVMEAGIELSEYYMPGLGGKNLREEHALESADAINKINPTFIRLRTLAIPQNTPLYEEWKKGNFEKCSEDEVVEEILMFIENLDGIYSILKSDHILNLLPEVEGKLPEDKQKMIKVLETYLSLPEEEKLLFKVGRRAGIFSALGELLDLQKRQSVRIIIEKFGITPENLEKIINELMSKML
ncbi:MAG: radical SAM protein [Candidatus Hydrogenedentes bacterium]|nr:radical SAM protein [Candidatus Hydrogenedentota bacterium]